MKKVAARPYAQPDYSDVSARYMGLATALLFACLFTLNIVAY
jgi:hypothetical protein